MITSTKNAEHYIWGDNCEGWHLLKSDSLSIIQERMPPGTAEQLHYHHHAQQVFYILSGKAGFVVDNTTAFVSAGQSIHIARGIKHHIFNKGTDDLHILVISEPKAHGDRTDL
ncbi:cupin domain-containing protein [Pedobacter miscanthi]|jgi:mannose-6-phosphate isomerase-like protein (cupin superfamily)|uniref:cupin domain-containing protein n=1 Tax=Pedobacter miscanthi TaxID=2259170 RepID=UPI00292DB6D8|nr:cupin domain-containing protein [Pedobacter miscanthi]